MKKDLDSIILTRQELEIMNVVWQRGAATVREVCSGISQKKKKAYTTVLTLMGILEEKGALTHTKAGRAYLYQPLLSLQQATHNQVHDLLDRFFEGNPQRLIENLLNSEATAPEQRESVKHLLESMGRNRMS